MAAGRPEPFVEFSEVAQKVLRKICDALFADLGEDGAKAFASTSGGQSVPQEEVVAFARRRATESNDMLDVIGRKVGYGPPHDAARLHRILKALGSKVGCLALTGRKGPIFGLTDAEVQDILSAWFTSSVASLRELGRAFKLLVSVAAMAGPKGKVCPNWKAIGYIVPDLAQMRAAVAENLREEWIDFSAHRPDFMPPERPLRAGADPASRELVVDCAVVGSGPGGATMAAELTEAGYKVAVIEFACWQHYGEQQCSEIDAFSAGYQEGGNCFTEHKDMTILAGSAFGGGAAVNWSCCLPPPQKVREEWAGRFGVPWAAGPEMVKAVTSAAKRLAMHAEDVKINKANDVLVRGCTKLGWPSEVAAQQGWEPKDPDNGGWCSAGWKYGSRQGMHGSALRDAALTGKLVVLDDCKADEVLTDADGRACGVQCTMRGGAGTTCKVVVRAKVVVASGGSLQTPLLLRRSGLRNKNIGRNLHVHPAMTVWGRFDEPINFTQGAPMTTVSRVVEDQDGNGYGAKIWVPNFHPITWAALMPWRGPKEYKEELAAYGHAAPLISLVRDQGKGKVWEDTNHRVRIDYAMKPADKKHLMSGGAHSARILVAAGATEVHSAHTGIEPLVLKSPVADTSKTPPELEEWIKRLEALGVTENSVGLGSAHQMSTCRMAGNPKKGAVRPTGETWEVPGLFVADASAFPSASGVNPMWTCAALSCYVSTQVKEVLAAAKEVQAPRAKTRSWKGCVTACAAAPTRPVVSRSGTRSTSRTDIDDLESVHSSETESDDGGPSAAAPAPPARAN